MAEAKLRFDPTCSTLSAMADRPNPVFSTMEEVSLIGTMATYDSQADDITGADFSLERCIVDLLSRMSPRRKTYSGDS